MHRGDDLADAARNGRLVVAALLACTACHLVVLRPFVVEGHLGRGQVQRGYFEKLGPRVGLALVDDGVDTGFPEGLGRDPDGNVSVSPGLSAALPLDVTGGYRIAGAGGTRTPDIAVGAAVVGAPGFFPAEPGSIAADVALTDAQELDVVDGRLRFVPWNVARPWRANSERLDRLARACSHRTSRAAFRVSLEHDRLSIHFGKCSIKERFAEPSPGRRVVVVMAGPSWDIVERTGSAWQKETRLSSVAWKATAAALVTAAGLLYVVGPLAALSTSITVGVVSIWYDAAAVVCLILTLLGIVLLTGWNLLPRLAPRRTPVRRLAAGALALLAIFAAIRMRRPEEPVPVEHGSAAPECLLTGYSAAGDSGLRPGTHGIGARLQECAPCGRSVATEARPGRTLGVIRDIACTSPAPVRPGGTLYFFGGANDDLLSWLATRNSFVQLLYQLRTFVAHVYFWKPGVDTVRRLERDVSAASLGVVDEQAAVLRGITDCATRGGFGLLFGQDFIVLDLDGGRPDARTTMVARRRAAIEQEGARFVDLLEAFRDEAGIHWFNDLMHASMIGHRRIAELMCETMAGAAAAHPASSTAPLPSSCVVRRTSGAFT